jgi:hypothetical protein
LSVEFFQRPIPPDEKRGAEAEDFPGLPAAVAAGFDSKTTLVHTTVRVAGEVVAAGISQFPLLCALSYVSSGERISNQEE